MLRLDANYILTALESGRKRAAPLNWYTPTPWMSLVSTRGVVAPVNEGRGAHRVAREALEYA